uniref:Protein ALP1-like n=1 Tax=Tanacetum cinerariifolium TaxID=118510 RepID=A0A699KG19_TANCI|nr:protein ALP1-like [Tanacetum cinerariifolium]
MSHELRLKRKVAEKAFEVTKEKDRTITRLKELSFLALSKKDLSDDDAYYINLQKAAIKQKLRLQMPPPSNNNDDDETEDDEYISFEFFNSESWRNGHQLTTSKELYDMKHFSARNVIERCFGIVKARQEVPIDPFETKNEHDEGIRELGM